MNVQQQLDIITLIKQVVLDARKDTLPAPPLVLLNYLKPPEETIDQEAILSLLNNYCTSNKNILQQRLSLLRYSSSTSASKQIAIQRRRYHIAYKKWFKPGAELTKIRKIGRNVIKINKDYFIRSLAPNRTGIILQQQFRFIESRESLEIVRRTTEGLGDVLARKVSDVWLETRERTINQLQALSQSLEVFTVIQAIPMIQIFPNQSGTSYVNPDFHESTWRQIKDVRYDVLVATSITSILSGLLSPIVGAFIGYASISSSQKQQIIDLKREASRISIDAMSEIYSFFLTPDPNTLTHNVVDTFFSQVWVEFIRELKHATQSQLKTMRYELLELERYSHLSDTEKTKVLDYVAERILMWDSIRGTIQNALTGL